MTLNNDKKIIGITGGIGSGKSALSAELKARGARVVDADLIARQVTQKNGVAFDEIVRQFGNEILNENGEINRAALGEIVFHNPQKLELLESITHKHIFERMQAEIESCTEDIIVLDVPLLFQCDFPINCDLTVAVIADEALRLERIMKRDNVSKEAALARMKNQLTNEEYRRLADLCFENNGDLKELKSFANKLCPQ